MCVDRDSARGVRTPGLCASSSGQRVPKDVSRFRVKLIPLFWGIGRTSREPLCTASRSWAATATSRKTHPRACPRRVREPLRSRPLLKGLSRPPSGWLRLSPPASPGAGALAEGDLGWGHCTAPFGCYSRARVVARASAGVDANCSPGLAQSLPGGAEACLEFLLRHWGAGLRGQWPPPSSRSFPPAAGTTAATGAAIADTRHPAAGSVAAGAAAGAGAALFGPTIVTA